MPPGSRRGGLIAAGVGIGAQAARRASWVSEVNRSMPAISPMNFAASTTPIPGAASSCGATSLTSAAILSYRVLVARRSSRMRRIMSRAIRTWVVCSASASRAVTLVCQPVCASAIAGSSRSGDRSCSRQRSSLDRRAQCPKAARGRAPVGGSRVRDRPILRSAASRYLHATRPERSPSHRSGQTCRARTRRADRRPVMGRRVVRPASPPSAGGPGGPCCAHSDRRPARSPPQSAPRQAPGRRGPSAVWGRLGRCGR